MAKVALEVCRIDVFHGQRTRKRKGYIQAHSAKVFVIKQFNSVYAALLSSLEEGAVAMRSTAAYRFWDDTIKDYTPDHDDNFGDRAGGGDFEWFFSDRCKLDGKKKKRLL